MARARVPTWHLHPHPTQERSIDPSISVPVYTSHAAAVSGGGAAGEMFLGAGERAALWLGAPPDDKLPKDAKEGELAVWQGEVKKVVLGPGEGHGHSQVAWGRSDDAEEGGLRRGGGGGWLLVQGSAPRMHGTRDVRL
jgi:hypothetical protein